MAFYPMATPSLTTDPSLLHPPGPQERQQQQQLKSQAHEFFAVRDRHIPPPFLHKAPDSQVLDIAVLLIQELQQFLDDQGPRDPDNLQVLNLAVLALLELHQHLADQGPGGDLTVRPCTSPLPA